MELKVKRLKNWFEMQEISLWTFLMWWYRHRNLENDDERDINAINYAISNWIYTFDTAELYASWYSETLLWEAIKGYNRNKLFIASKVKWSNCSYEAIKKACKKSLERIWTDYLDLYYIHWRENQFDLEDCMRALEELKDEWLIKNIWVSNFSTETMKKAQSFCKKYKIVANQVHYNLIFREAEKDWLLNYCQENDIMLVSYRPLELWKLANWWWDLVNSISEETKKTYSQIAINWIISQKNVVTIFKSSNTEHIKENIWSSWWKLNIKEIENLRENKTGQIYISDCVKLN